MFNVERESLTCLGIDSFLKMISAAAGGTVVNYSDRFTLTGMSGTFPPTVETAIKGISGTGGPPTENNVNNNANPAAGGGNNQPYSLQTGLTKYAPMQRKPGTKITVKTASMQYPTSAVPIAKTALPIPKQVTTMTASATYAVSSMENTVRSLLNASFPFYRRLTILVGCCSAHANEQHAEILKPLARLRKSIDSCTDMMHLAGREYRSSW